MWLARHRNVCLVYTGDFKGAYLVGVHVGDGVQHLLHVRLDMSGREFYLRAIRESPQVVLQVLERHVHVTLLKRMVVKGLRDAQRKEKKHNKGLEKIARLAQIFIYSICDNAKTILRRGTHSLSTTHTTMRPYLAIFNFAVRIRDHL